MGCLDFMENCGKLMKSSWEIFMGIIISWDLVGFDGDLTEFNGDLMDTYFVDIWCSSFIAGKSNGFAVVYLGSSGWMGIHHQPFVLFRHPSEWHHHSERHGLKSDWNISAVCTEQFGFSKNGILWSSIPLECGKNVENMVLGACWLSLKSHSSEEPPVWLSCF